MRSLIRLKNSITKDITRQKNRIKSQLRYLGVEIPTEFIEPQMTRALRELSWSEQFAEPLRLIMTVISVAALTSA